MKLWLTLIISVGFKFVAPVEFVIQIPEYLNLKNGIYKLDYFPSQGSPAPNTTISAKDMHMIHYSDALPGTRYDFTLYFSNSTISSLPTWQGVIFTSPDPPTNLSVTIRGSKVAVINWSPPLAGNYHHYQLKVVSLSEIASPRNISLLPNSSPYNLKDLTPGGTYQVQLYSVYYNAVSKTYISQNFTTKPTTPGKFIVWFRNETTLLVLWQPSYPVTIFSHYKVSIDPPDALESIKYVEREGEPPGPAQTFFTGLVPGRAYNVSVQTVSKEQLSAPTTSSYRTIPLKPLSLTYDKASLTSRSVRVMWEPPKSQCEFDKYQISVRMPGKRPETLTIPITRGRDESTICDLSDSLEPGHTYQILVKTMSAKVVSWPAILNVTLKPLPVIDLKSFIDPSTGNLKIKWQVDNSSYQESFKISYSVTESLDGDNAIFVDTKEYELDSLLPGRNYSISVKAISNQIESNERTIYQATKPLSPIIEKTRIISVRWKIIHWSSISSRRPISNENSFFPYLLD